MTPQHRSLQLPQESELKCHLIELSEMHEASVLTYNIGTKAERLLRQNGPVLFD